MPAKEIKRRIRLTEVIGKSINEKEIQPITQPLTSLPPDEIDGVGITRHNFLSAAAEAEVDARIVCNAVKVFSPLIAASCGDSDKSLGMLSAAENISVRALELSGIPVDKIPFSLSRMLPVVAEVVATLEENGHEFAGESLDDIAKMVATVGGSRQSKKIIQENYVANDDVTDVRITLMSAMMPVVTEIVFYRFDTDLAKDINACMATALAAVKKEIPAVIPAESDDKAAVMIAQSMTRNSLRQMAICWRRQAEQCAISGGIDRTTPDGGAAQAQAWRDRVFDDFHRVFTATFSAVRRYVSNGTPAKADIQGDAERRKSSLKPT